MARIKLNIAQEIIDFQSDDFADQLEAIMTEIQTFVKEYGAGCGRALMKSGLSEKMSALIFKRTGIQSEINLDSDMFGAILVCYLTTNHVLLDSFFHGAGYIKEQKAIVDAAKKKAGWVDLKRARVGGVFSEYKHPIEFGSVLNFLHCKLTPRECAAIMIHEVGHAFTYYEFSDRMTVSNQILLDLATAVNENDSKKRVFLLKELGENLDGNPDMFDDIGDETNRTIFGLKLFRRCVGWVSGQMPMSRLNEVTPEQLADNFATRFGLGKELVTGLFRIDELCESPELSASYAGTVSFFSNTFVFLSIVAGAVLGSVACGFFAAGWAALYLLSVPSYGENAKDYEHGEIRIRYKRIRDALIERLSRGKYDKEVVKKLIADIKVIDAILPKLQEAKTFTDHLADFLFKKNRDTRADTILQLLLEDLTHNNLFLKSAELQTLGK